MKVIILAGGVGKRLWPISKASCPKQFLNLFDKKSLLQRTIERFDKIASVDHILIATNIQYEKLLEQQKLESSKKISIVYEPFSKNTAPAIALSVKYLQEMLKAGAEEPILVLPSDHQINPIEVFFEALNKGLAMLDGIITFGIKPTRAETGYGYIKVNKGHEIAEFIEKPPVLVAQQIYNKTGYFWNSGMFLFTPKIFWAAMQKHQKTIYELAKSYRHFFDNFSKVPEISFDRAIMEKTAKAYCLPIQVAWSDIGSWESLYDILGKDANQNVKVGNVVDLDTKNSFIVSQKKMISTIGLEDIICIETEDTIFLAKKGKSQDLKRLLELINLKKDRPNS